MCLSVITLYYVCLVQRNDGQFVTIKSWSEGAPPSSRVTTRITRQLTRLLRSIAPWIHPSETTTMMNSSEISLDINHELLQQSVPVAPLLPSLRPHRFPVDNFTVPENTQMYGWTPEVYPNPLVDTSRCGIDYLSEDENLTVNMRLCDPDWVLGREGLDDIAMSLYNFSTTFGVAADNRHWEVVVENEEPSSGRRVRIPPARRKLRGTEPFDGSPQRSLFGLNIFSPLTADSDADNSWVMVPPVELAVATVRKVRQQYLVIMSFVFLGLLTSCHCIVDESTRSSSTGLVLHLRG